MQNRSAAVGRREEILPILLSTPEREVQKYRG